MSEWENSPDVIIFEVYLYSSLTGDACYKVMLQSGNYDLVHELFGKMRRSGEVPEALTYKGSILILSCHLQLIFGSLWPDMYFTSLP